jgi:hypothetical protein
MDGPYLDNYPARSGASPDASFHVRSGAGLDANFPLRRPVRRTELPSAYVALYAIIAAGALGFLALDMTRPDIVGNALASLGIGEQAAGGVEARVVADLKGEALGLRQNVGQLQIDVAKLRNDMQASEEHGAALAGRVAALEKAAETAATATAPVAAAEPAPVAPPRKTAAAKAAEARRAALAAAAAAKGAALPPAAAAEAVSGAAPVAPALLNRGAAAASSIETGSLGASAAPVSFGPAVVTPAAKPLAVMIGSGASLDALRLSWSLLTDRNKDTLANLEARYVQSGEGDVGYGLLAGPIKSQADAKRICKALEARGTGCRISDFGGNAL